MQEDELIVRRAHIEIYMTQGITDRGCQHGKGSLFQLMQRKKQHMTEYKKAAEVYDIVSCYGCYDLIWIKQEQERETQCMK